MVRFVFKIVFFVLLFQSYTVIGQKIYYQDIFNGGVTGGGYNPTWNSNAPGVIQLHIEPGSTIRKAFLLVGMYNNPAPNTMQINGVTVQLDSTIVKTDMFTGTYLISQLKTGVIDITNLIDATVTSLNITPPISQPNINQGGRYVEFYIYIAYENSLLSKTNAVIVLNEQNSAGIMNYTINPNPMDLSNNIGLAMQTSHICDTINDGSFVAIDGTTIGLIGGEDENTPFTCAGVTGSFYYQNSTLFGLSDDVANSTMAGPDVIANIESYIINEDEVSIRLIYQGLNNPITPNATQSNPIWQLYFTYTTPCDFFETTLLTSDTTTCPNVPLQEKRRHVRVGKDVKLVIENGFDHPRADMVRVDAGQHELLGDFRSLRVALIIRRAIFFLPRTVAFIDARLDETGAENRHADILRRKLLHPAFRHADHRIFRRRIGLHARCGNDPRHRRRVNIMPALAMRTDMRQENLHAIDDAHHIDGDGPFPVARLHRADGAARADARIVADHMHLAEGVERSLRRALDRCPLRHVAVHAFSLDLAFAQIFQRHAKIVLVDIGKHHIHARRAESPRHRKANAACAARHESGLAG